MGADSGRRGRVLRAFGMWCAVRRAAGRVLTRVIVSVCVGLIMAGLYRAGVL